MRPPTQCPARLYRNKAELHLNWVSWSPFPRNLQLGLEKCREFIFVWEHFAFNDSVGLKQIEFKLFLLEKNERLFGISRELHFRACNHSQPCAGPHTAKEGEFFYKKEQTVGRATVNRKFMVFIGWVFAVKEEESIHFLHFPIWSRAFSERAVWIKR